MNVLESLVTCRTVAPRIARDPPNVTAKVSPGISMERAESFRADRQTSACDDCPAGKMLGDTVTLGIIRGSVGVWAKAVRTIGPIMTAASILVRHVAISSSSAICVRGFDSKQA
jgi:hypothetical protein